MKKRYIKANRKERSHLLDEMEAYTNLHRKSLIRLLRTEIHEAGSKAPLAASGRDLPVIGRTLLLAQFGSWGYRGRVPDLAVHTDLFFHRCSLTLSFDLTRRGNP
jgi:hypothetical protein